MPGPCPASERRVCSCRRSRDRHGLVDNKEQDQTFASERRVIPMSAATQFRHRCSGALIPKFVKHGRAFLYELRNQRGTGNSMILVSLLNPKFAIEPAARGRELRVRDTGICAAGLMLGGFLLSGCSSASLLGA